MLRTCPPILPCKFTVHAGRVKACGKTALNADYSRDAKARLTREPPSHNCRIYGTELGRCLW